MFNMAPLGKREMGGKCKRKRAESEDKKGRWKLERKKLCNRGEIKPTLWCYEKTLADCRRGKRSFLMVGGGGIWFSNP
jgi:hypothetical protein